MMRTFVIGVVAAILLLVAAPAQAAADTVSAAKLLASPESFDGKQITVSGELIGDYGFRDDGTVWAQLNDDAYALEPLRDGGTLRGANLGIGIRADAEFFVALDPPGRYNRVGPVVRVTGTWRYHDPERGGETFLDVTSLEVVRPGRPVGEDSRVLVLTIGLVLAFTAAGLLFLGAARRNRE